MKLSSLAFDLSQFLRPLGEVWSVLGAGLKSTFGQWTIIGDGRPCYTPLGRRRPLVSDRCQRDCGVSTNQRSMGDWTKHPAENETRLLKQARPVLRLSIKATRIRRGSRRAMRSDIRNTLGNILHAASLTLSWAVASDMID